MPARQPSSHNRQRCYPNWVVVVRCRCPLAGILPRGWPWWAAGHWPDTRCRIALTACYEWWYNDGALASFCRDRSKLGRILPLDRFSRFCRQVEILASYRQKRGDATALRDLNGGGGAVNRPFACREAEQQVAIIVRAIRREPEFVFYQGKTAFSRDNAHSVNEHPRPVQPTGRSQERGERTPGAHERS